MGDMGINKVQTAEREVRTYETDLKKKVGESYVKSPLATEAKDEYIQPSTEKPMNFVVASGYKRDLQETCLYYDTDFKGFLQDRQCQMQKDGMTTTMNVNKSTATAKVGIFGKTFEVLGLKVSIGTEAITMKEGGGGNSSVVPALLIQ